MLCKILALAVFGLLTRGAAAQSLDVVTPKKTVALQLADLKSKLKSYTIKIDDPVYKQVKEFDAFLLKDVFELAGLKANDKTDEVVFTAVDGYAPQHHLRNLKQPQSLFSLPGPLHAGAFRAGGRRQTNHLALALLRDLGRGRKN